MTFKNVFTTICLLLGGVALVTEIAAGKPMSTGSSSWDIKPTPPVVLIDDGVSGSYYQYQN